MSSLEIPLKLNTISTDLAKAQIQTAVLVLEQVVLRFHVAHTHARLKQQAQAMHSVIVGHRDMAQPVMRKSCTSSASRREALPVVYCTCM